MRSLVTFAVLAILRLDPCGGGDGGGDGTTQKPAPGGGGETTPPGGGGAGQPGGNGNAAGVTVPEAFYLRWYYQTVTSYSNDGSEPKVSSASGSQLFTFDKTYTQSYQIGSVGFTNEYEGTYVVTGPDERVEGAFKIVTTDQEGQKATWGVAIDGVGMAMTLYGEDGKPSIIMGLGLSEK